MEAELLSDPHLNHLFDGELNLYHSEITNLSAGAPGPDILKKCVDIFQLATADTLKGEKEHAFLFQYGITSGLWEYREELSKFLTARYGSKVHRENLILTCGATHGLLIILTTIINPCGIIFVEEATYMNALDMFKQFTAMKIVPVPIDDQGVNVDALERIAKAERAKKVWDNNGKLFWSMFYTVPVYHNPTGITLSQDRCRSLVKLARDIDMVVVCDDMYNLLHYEYYTPVPERLFAYDVTMEEYAGGHVISNASFSKILAPGVRVGWLEVSPRIALNIRNSGYLKSGGGTNQYMAGLLRSTLQLGLEGKLLDELVQKYKEKMKVVCEILQEHLPPGCSFIPPKGGYFIWIRMPEAADMNEFVPWCERKYKVSAIPGSRFSICNKYKNHLRISIAFHNKTALQSAVQRLCDGLKKFLKKTVAQSAVQRLCNGLKEFLQH